jgi:hypothetical protein
MADGYKPVLLMIQDGAYVQVDLKRLELIPNPGVAHEYTTQMNATTKTALSSLIPVGFPEELETNVSYNYNMRDNKANEETRQAKIRNGLEELVVKAGKVIQKTNAKFMLVDVRSIKIEHDYSTFNIKMKAQGLVETK